MKPLSEITTDTLYWVQPKHAPGSFELLDGEELIGTLQWDAFWGRRASGEVADKRWTIKRTGIFPARIGVYDPGSEAAIASFKPGVWRTSWLTLPSGSVYYWQTDNIISTTAFSFRRPQGQALLQFKLDAGSLSNRLGGGIFKTKVRVTIAPEVRALPEIPLLLVLGAHLMAIQDLSR